MTVHVNVGTLIKTTDGPPRFANDARGTKKKKNNSCFRVKDKKIFLQSTAGIKPDKEIFADYGPEYWPRSYYRKKKKNFILFFSKKMASKKKTTGRKN